MMNILNNNFMKLSSIVSRSVLNQTNFQTINKQNNKNVLFFTHRIAISSNGIFQSKRFLFSPAPLQSFHHDSKMLELPSSSSGLRPYQGLDMRKIQNNPWINVFTTRRKMETGYQWSNYGGPSIHAPTMNEVAAFFDCSDWKNKYSYKEMIYSAYPQLRILLMFVGCILLPVIPCISYIFQQQRFEPMEVTMPQDEFFKYFRWHYYGPELDHHNFSNYLEARRSVKWRNADLITEDYIPSIYKDDKLN